MRAGFIIVIFIFLAFLLYDEICHNLIEAPKDREILKEVCTIMCNNINLQYHTSSIYGGDTCTCKNISISGWSKESPYIKFVNYA